MWSDQSGDCPTDVYLYKIVSYDNKNALEQIRYSHVPVLSEYVSIFSAGYSGVSALSASVTKEPPQLRTEPQVVLSVMGREFRALTLYGGVFFPSCKNGTWEGEKGPWA